MTIAIFRTLLVVYLLLVSIRSYNSPYDWTLINNVNLIFHEAGHALFIFFGQFVHVLGGTFFEIGIPALVTAYFLSTRQLLGAGFGLWWLSTALHSVSLYANDATDQILPLLGGEGVIHDWHYLLAETRLLAYDGFIAGIFMAGSLLCLAVSLWLFGHTIYRDLVSTQTIIRP